MKNNANRLLILLWLIVVVVAGLAFKKYLELLQERPQEEEKTDCALSAMKR